MAQAWRSARRFSLAALVAAFTLMIAAALLGTPDVAAASANSGRYAKPHVDVIIWGSVSPRPAPGPPGSPANVGAPEEIVAAGAPEVPVPVPQEPAPDGPVRSPVPPPQMVAAPVKAAAPTSPTSPRHPAEVRSLDTERLGRSLVFTGGAAALL